MNLNYHTLNGRFNLVALCVLCLLLGITLYAHQSVRLSASRSLQNIEVNRALRERLDRYRNSLQATESALYQYSTFLGEQQHEELFRQVGTLVGAAEHLGEKHPQDTSSLLQHKLRELHETSLQLVQSIGRYSRLMQHVESRYPGMPILITHLEPTNRMFAEAVEVALQEGELAQKNPRLITGNHYRIMQLFQEARYAWSMQISWFRIFVANRMGVFGEPEAAMQSNLSNRDLYVSKVEVILERLQQFKGRGELGLQQEESVQQMREAMEYYETHLKRAIDIYFSENWRADIPLLRNELQPLLDKLWNTTRTIEHAVADLNKAGLDKAQETSSVLSYFIWLFTGIVSILLYIAYQVFQNNIRRPVLAIANSMITQQSPTNSIRPSSNIEEINRLIESYTSMREQVDNRQRRLQSILDNAAEGIITIDNSGLIESINKAAEKLFDYTPDELIGKLFIELIDTEKHDHDLDAMQHEFEQGGLSYTGREREVGGRRRNGETFVMSLKFSEMQIAGERLYTAIVADISDRRAMMDNLLYMAEHDSLTGLHNRQFFNDALERCHVRSMRSKQVVCACIYIDLDNFKYVNDTLGHLEGDRLLIGIANALKSRTRKSDVLARLGGDEFSLLLTETNPEQARLVAENFRQTIADFSFTAGGKRIKTGCSIGVAVSEPEIRTKEELLARADIACHMAKRAGRNRVYVFEKSDKNCLDDFQKDMGWSNRIRLALEQGSFVFCCQPILRVTDAGVHGQELLLHMFDKEIGTYLAAGGFIDPAERFGLMPEIDRWVGQHALEWIDTQGRDSDTRFFIRLSARSIGDQLLLETLRKAREVLGIDPARIVFEISDAVAISGLDKLKRFIAALRDFGFAIALRDFGVDQTSFAYLRELDVDYVRIDASFIDSLHKDELNQTLVRAINDVCHTLGQATIAERTNQAKTLSLLKKIGVDFVQDNSLAPGGDHARDSLQLHIV